MRMQRQIIMAAPVTSEVAIAPMDCDSDKGASDVEPDEPAGPVEPAGRALIASTSVPIECECVVDAEKDELAIVDVINHPVKIL